MCVVDCNCVLMKRKATEEAEKQAQRQKVEAQKQIATKEAKQQAQEKEAEKKIEATKLKLDGDKLKLVDEQQAVDERRRLAEEYVAQLVIDAKEMEVVQKAQRQAAAHQKQMAIQQVAQLLVQKQELKTQEHQLATQKEQLAIQQQQLEARQVAKMEVQQPQLKTEQLIAELLQHLQTVVQKLNKLQLLISTHLEDEDYEEFLTGQESWRKEVSMIDSQLHAHLKLAITRTHQLGIRHPSTGMSTGWSEAAHTFISFQFGRLRDARPALSPSELVQWGEKLWSLRGQEERQEWFDFAKEAKFKVSTSKEFQAIVNARDAIACNGVTSLLIDNIILPEVTFKTGSGKSN